MLHSYMQITFPIDDPEFQQDLALAFKFVHAAGSKQYGSVNLFMKQLISLKKISKW